MKIAFTKHALDNFKRFKKYSVIILKKSVSDVIKYPDNIDRISDKPKIIASKTFNDRLVLRVVYKETYGIITIITFYVAKEGRYYESN